MPPKVKATYIRSASPSPSRDPNAPLMPGGIRPVNPITSTTTAPFSSPPAGHRGGQGESIPLQASPPRQQQQPRQQHQANLLPPGDDLSKRPSPISTAPPVAQKSAAVKADAALVTHSQDNISKGGGGQTVTFGKDHVDYNDDDADDDYDEESDDDDRHGLTSHSTSSRFRSSPSTSASRRPRYSSLHSTGAYAHGGRLPDRVIDPDELLANPPGYSRLASYLPWWLPPRVLLFVLTGALIVGVTLSFTLRKIHNRLVVAHCIPVAPRNATAQPRYLPDLPAPLPPDPWAEMIAGTALLDAHVARENTYFDGMTADLASLRSELVSEINARGASSAGGGNPPLEHWRHTDGMYYALRADLAAYVRAPVREALATDAAEKIVYLRALLRLRLNDELPAIGFFEVSPDGSHLALAVDRSGNERFDVYVWDVVHQRRVGTGLAAKDAYYTARWVSNSVLVASVVDALGVPRGAVRIAVEGAGGAAPTTTMVQVYWEERPERTLNVGASADGSMLVLQSAGQISQRPRVVSAEAMGAADWTPDQMSSLTATVGDDDADEYGISEVEHHQGYLYVRTNEALPDRVAPNLNMFEVVRLPYDTRFPTNVTRAQLANAERIWAHSPGIFVEKMEVLQRYLVLWVRTNGRREIRWRAIGLGVSDPSWKRLGEWDSLAFYSVTPGFASDIGDPSSRVYRRFDASAIEFSNSSLVQPQAMWELDLAGGGVVPVVAEQASAIDPTRYARFRVWVNAATLSVSGQLPPSSFFANPAGGDYVPVDLAWRYADGEQVPQGKTRDGSTPLWVRTPGTPARPTLVSAYGAYGTMNDASYDPGLLALMDRGVVVALLHPRGDGDLGPAWYHAGARMHKANTMVDVERAIAGLINAGVAEKEKVALMGRSAGGLVVGSAVAATFQTCGQRATGTNGRALWSGLALVIAQVPFIDLVADMADVSVPWTTYEHREWGDPRNATELAYLANLSPYDRLNVDLDRGACWGTVANRTLDDNADDDPTMPWPAVVVTTGKNDARVPYSEPVRWAARMRHVQALAFGAVAVSNSTATSGGGGRGAVATAEQVGSEQDVGGRRSSAFSDPIAPEWASSAAKRVVSQPHGGLQVRDAINPSSKAKCRETTDITKDRPVLVRVYSGGHFSGKDAAGEAEWMSIALQVFGLWTPPESLPKRK
ncbi:hypothetical protein BCR44DRAFT_1044451 [Catenaria anguillulae PL171]|uniref:Prolyl endopeptidase-like n=1 Tax=Catenaria anguillulae PL171 TaxID=765915 RepID=A0A1Y2HRZ1_9FUNG|nr:hypothetical protein BCR44DRAFT_1044451 [Catenaria anguillulae PL171]